MPFSTVFIGDTQPHSMLQFLKAQNKAIGRPTSITF